MALSIEAEVTTPKGDRIRVAAEPLHGEEKVELSLTIIPVGPGPAVRADLHPDDVWELKNALSAIQEAF